jgi:serine/threonine-protein kinase
MGAVYRARHVALDAMVAVKVMHEDIAVDAMFAERFHREARAASRLDHPNVIRVIDFGLEPDGHLYIVMEYVEGYDLFQVIRRDSPLSESRIVDLLSQALSGIAAAHDTGVVHRDLKPENIMVTTRVGDDGASYEVVKVCDFGIAQFSEPARAHAQGGVPQRTLTARGVLLGTPQYMSPEQARGEVTDARTDVYSLGVILYQLLTGELPFDGPTPIDTVLKHISEEPRLPTELVPAASPRLEAVCLKALAKRREGRWASAREMRAALKAERTSTPVRDTLGSPNAPVYGIPTPAPTTSAPAFAEPRIHELHETMPSFRRGPVRTVTYVGVAVAILLLGAGIFVAKGEDAEPSVPSAQAAVTRSPEGPPKVVAAPPAVTNVPTTQVAETSPPGPRPARNAGVRRPGRSVEPPARADDDHPMTSSLPAHAEELAGTPSEPEPTPTPAATRAPQPPPAPERTPPEAHTAAPFTLRPGSLRVKWHVAQVGGGATSGDVTRSLSRAATAWNGCYESGLRSRGRRVEGQGTLRLSCDDQGRVVNARFSGTGMSDVATCVQSSVTGLTIPNADTGEAWATVAVTLAVAE